MLFFDRLAGNVRKLVVIFTISRRSYYVFQCKIALRREEIVVASHTPYSAIAPYGVSERWPLRGQNYGRYLAVKSI